MKIELFKAELLAYLLPFFEPLGFKYVKSNHEFIKKTPDIELSYLLICTTFSGFISIDVGAYIRFLTTKKEFSKILPKQYKYVSIGNDIRRVAEYLNSQGCSYEETGLLDYEHGTDPTPVFESIKIKFETICTTFFQRCASLEACNQIYNKLPYEYNSLRGRLLPGLLIAKLCNDPNLPQLIKIYDEEIKKYSDDEKELYPSVRAYVLP